VPPSPKQRSLLAASVPDDLGELSADGVQPHDHVAASLVQGWLQAYAATRDPRVRERIILAYLGLADRLAGRYVRSQGVTLDDLRQAARMGLIAAVDRYDPTRGTPFVPYAVACVRGELRRYLRDATWTLRIARPLKERSLAVCRALDELPGRLGREPTIAEVAEHVAASPQQVVEAIGAARTRCQHSLDQPLQTDGETTLGELLADAGPREEPEDLLVLRELVSQLPERERRVIHLTYVGELTQAEIARGMGCSQMQISRVLRRGLDRLRRQLLAADGEPGTRVPPSACPPPPGARRPPQAPDSAARHRLRGSRRRGCRARPARPASRPAAGCSGPRRQPHGARSLLTRRPADPGAGAAAMAAGRGGRHLVGLAGHRPRGPPPRCWRWRKPIDGPARVAPADKPAEQPCGRSWPTRGWALRRLLGCTGTRGLSRRAGCRSSAAPSDGAPLGAHVGPSSPGPLLSTSGRPIRSCPVGATDRSGRIGHHRRP
jgi:RNA polymerase sigma-B factor